MWHFDGNLTDSSYHNNSLKFTDNAYYNYIESDFNGALSLTDGVVHTLKATLPFDLSGDFTIEGRATFTDTADLSDVLNDYLSGYSQNAYTSSTNSSYSYYHYYKSIKTGDASTDFETVKGYAEDLFNALGLTFDIDDWTYSSSTNSSGGYTTHTYKYPYVLQIPYKSSSPLVSLGALSLSKGSYLSFNNVYFDYYNPNPSNYYGHFYVQNSGSSEIPLSSFSNIIYDYNYTFALVRQDDTISYFENGILKNTYSDSSNFGNELLLTVTADQTAVWDELRVSNVALYTEDYTPSSQPFDTNLVLVLPESGTENDIAVKSNVSVSDMRVGGVRPTYPTNGYVYVYLENDVVKDVQQYQTDGWYSVDACIYQDEEWVNLYNTDLSAYVLEDDTTDDSTGDSTDDNTSSDDTSTDEDESTEGLLSKIISTITDFITGLLDTLFGGILDLITIITDNLSNMLESFSGIIGLLTSLFGFLPDEMTAVLTSGLALAFIVIIIKILT